MANFTVGPGLYNQTSVFITVQFENGCINNCSEVAKKIKFEIQKPKFKEDARKKDDILVRRIFEHYCACRPLIIYAISIFKHVRGAVEEYVKQIPVFCVKYHILKGETPFVIW